jgi:hypothetical protein
VSAKEGSRAATAMIKAVACMNVVMIFMTSFVVVLRDCNGDDFLTFELQSLMSLLFTARLSN